MLRVTKEKHVFFCFSSSAAGEKPFETFNRINYNETNRNMYTSDWVVIIGFLAIGLSAIVGGLIDMYNEKPETQRALM